MRIILCLFMTAGLILVVNPAVAIVINEINFDPGITDANQDGLTSSTQDEFIELVNESATPIDLSGWSLHDSIMERHVFPGGFILDPGWAVVVFGGGDLSHFDSLTGCVAQLASSGSLSLGNSGDTVSLYDTSMTLQATYLYLIETPDVSITRYNDVTGSEPLVAHTSVSVLECSPGTQVDGSFFPVSTAPAAQMIINEISYDPGTVDANNDGVIDPVDDEFVELVNVNGGDVDLFDWTLADGGGIRHRFDSVIIPDGGAMVVFGGGSLTSFTASPAVVASFGTLGLENTGDTVTLRDHSGTVVATYTYDGSVSDESITRYPDITGGEPFVAHSSVSPWECSPGLRVDLSSIIPLPTEWFRDNDDDGFGDDGDTVWAVDQPVGYVAQGGDCDDDDDTVYPGAPEACGDGKDNDCDTEVDEGCVVFEILSVTDVGNDQGGQVRVRWSAHEDDAAGEPDPIVSYSLYRRIDGNKNIDTSDWDFLLNVPAATQTAYNAVAPTLCDSTDTGICWSVFAVRAHTAAPGNFFDTEPDSGYSIDNLAPSPPQNPVVVGGSLSWDELLDPDVRYVTVYGSASELLDGSEVVIGHAIGTDYDVSGDAHAWYLLTATDFAGNESGATVVSSGLSDVPGAVPARTILLGNWPNPFNPATVIVFDLDRDLAVDLSVYDVSGRIVRVIARRRILGAGRHETPWDGRDQAGRTVPAGVYFYRMVAGDYQATGRMALVK